MTGVYVEAVDPQRGFIVRKLGELVQVREQLRDLARDEAQPASGLGLEAAAVD